MKKTDTSPRSLELLAPARDVLTARAAILHGADAVYIGPQAFGARAAAGNSSEDIRLLCEYAHMFGVKIYATVNTILHDSELPQVEKLVWDLWRAGADALIVQDMALLRMNLPPIELHASTQCDTRTPAKASFLQEAGFAQIVLARELSLSEISDICRTVNARIEVFVHGALCVSYSGRCHISQVLCGRSANRGECAQYCRYKYDLYDASGKSLAKDKHLLSMHDFNASALIKELAEAGAQSFKIEGRLKDASYVANITAHYRRVIDQLIESEPDKYRRSSWGKSYIGFSPDPYKSFNRGFTSYFLTERRPKNLASLLTPKSLGEPLKDMHDVHNGDGLAFFTPEGEYTGFLVNGVVDGKPIPNRRLAIPRGSRFFRTLDADWERRVNRARTSRTIALHIALYPNRIEAKDERGVKVVLPHHLDLQEARTPQDIRRSFAKLGDTIYRLSEFDNYLGENIFIPASAISALRRQLVDALDRTARTTWHRELRKPENIDCKYPAESLDFRDNVANRLAAQFYREHGVKNIEPALESGKTAVSPGAVLMTMRHCVLRELGKCLKEPAGKGVKLPLRLSGTGRDLELHPCCDRCEMEVRLLSPQKKKR